MVEVTGLLLTDLVSADNAPDVNPDFVNNLGTIEVVVLRCKADPGVSDPRPTARLKVSDARHTPSPAIEDAKSQSKKRSEKAASPAASMSGGMFGLFDGPADYEPYGTGRIYGAYDSQRFTSEAAGIGHDALPRSQQRNLSSGSWQPIGGHPLFGHQEDRFGGLPQVETILSDPADYGTRKYPTKGILKQPISKPQARVKSRKDNPLYAGLSDTEIREARSLLRQNGVTLSESDASSARAESGLHNQPNEAPQAHRHVSFESPASRYTPSSNANAVPNSGPQPQPSYLGSKPYEFEKLYSHSSPLANTQHRSPYRGAQLAPPVGFESGPPLADRYRFYPPGYGMNGMYPPNDYDSRTRDPTIDNAATTGTAPVPSNVPEGLYRDCREHYFGRSASDNQHEHVHVQGYAEPGGLKSNFSPWNGYRAKRSESQSSMETLTPKDDKNHGRNHGPIDWAESRTKIVTKDSPGGQNRDSTPSRQNTTSTIRSAQTAHSDKSKHGSNTEPGKSGNGWDGAQKSPNQYVSTGNAWDQGEPNHKAGNGGSSWEVEATNDKPASVEDWNADRPSNETAWDTNKPAGGNGWNDKSVSDKSRNMNKSASVQGWGDKPASDKGWSTGKPASAKGWDDKPASNKSWDDKPASNKGWDDKPISEKARSSEKPVSNRDWNDKPASGQGWNDKPASEKAQSTSKSANGNAWNTGKQASVKDAKSNSGWNDNDQKSSKDADGWGHDNQQQQQQHKKDDARSKAPPTKIKSSTKGDRSTRSSNDGPDSPPKIRIKRYWSQWREPMSIIVETAEERYAKAHDPYISPAEPLTPITPEMARGNNVEHQVKRGKGAAYMHITGTPDYLDDLEHPYAVFSFKYRSRRFLEKKFKIEIKDDVQEQDDVKAQLAEMSKEQLAEELYKLKVYPHLIGYE